jgi:hypothetical protein
MRHRKLITDFIPIEAPIEQFDGRKTCFQKIQKNSYAYFFDLPNDKSLYDFREVTYAHAEYIIKKFEWLGGRYATVIGPNCMEKKSMIKILKEKSQPYKKGHERIVIGQK